MGVWFSDVVRDGVVDVDVLVLREEEVEEEEEGREGGKDGACSVVQVRVGFADLDLDWDLLGVGEAESGVEDGVKD